MAATATAATNGRVRLGGSTSSRAPDALLKWGLSVLAVAVLLLIAFFFVRLITESSNALSTFGFRFIFVDNWNLPRQIYEALALVVGTLITAAIALIFGVPVAVGTALYLTETCPLRIRAVLGGVIDLLAAVPSVVYGLWGFTVLGPRLVPVEKWVSNTFSFIPFIGPPPSGTVAIGNYFIAGLILAIMILPIVSALSREVLNTVPPEHKEAALALGATRWEMIRGIVLPTTSSGVIAACVLGFGRAIGEAIAVSQVVGGEPLNPVNWFKEGDTLAAALAIQYPSPIDNLHASALLYLAAILFVFGLIVNLLARQISSGIGTLGAFGTLK